MEIIVAKAAGFCFGVKRAVDAVHKNIERQNLITFGPIIHNQQVVDEFSAKGVTIANKAEDTKDGVVIIRSHGISPQMQEEINVNANEIVDATCPFVKRIHKLVKKHYDLGYSIVLCGSPEHPEMIGINGWCENTAYHVKNVEEAQALPELDKIFLASQTTMSASTFEKIIPIVQGKAKEDFQMVNTICSATEERQEAAKELALQVDKVVVVGGYESSNTQKLVSICKQYCEYVVHVETPEELPISDFRQDDKIGITAGASTPDWIIKAVVNTLKNLFEDDNKQFDFFSEVRNLQN